MKQNESIQRGSSRIKRLSAYAFMMQERMRRQAKEAQKTKKEQQFQQMLDEEIRKLAGN